MISRYTIILITLFYLARGESGDEILAVKVEGPAPPTTTAQTTTSSTTIHTCPPPIPCTTPACICEQCPDTTACAPCEWSTTESTSPSPTTADPGCTDASIADLLESLKEIGSSGQDVQVKIKVKSKSKKRIEFEIKRDKKGNGWKVDRD